MREREVIEIIERAFGSAEVEVGVGDDAAVIDLGGRRAVVTTDALHEGVHFERSWISPRDLGARAVEVNLSDLAAMGALPHSLLLALAAPSPLDERLVRGVVDGFAERARERGCAVIGGNVSRGAALSLTVTAIGTLESSERPLLRSGARPGELVFVSGPLGGAALGVRLLAAGVGGDPAAARAVERFRSPRARVELGRALHGVASAAIDVSDGLARDLGHLARASGAGATVRVDRVPTIGGASAIDLVLGGGEDYELLFTAPVAERDRAIALGGTEIGTIDPGGEVVFLDESGAPHRPSGGFEHF